MLTPLSQLSAVSPCILCSVPACMAPHLVSTVGALLNESMVEGSNRQRPQGYSDPPRRIYAQGLVPPPLAAAGDDDGCKTGLGPRLPER